MNTNTLAETFTERLRNTTALPHKNLESLPLSVAIVSPAVTVQQYGGYLAVMHDVVKDAEDNIYPLLKDVIPNVEARYKAAYMVQDLAVSGIGGKNAFTPVFSVRQNISPAFALGIMYVVEGSSLGGRMILKNIEQALGFNPDNGARYFAGYGNHTGSYWKSFLSSMAKFEEDNACGDEIIAGATFAFNAISKHFTEAPQNSL